LPAAFLFPPQFKGPAMPTRREKIEAMLEKDPHDAFLKYGLSQELEKEGDHERSLTLLAELRRLAPPYVAAFFMAAQQLTKLGRIDEARGILRDGIEEARRQRNDHAAGEMSEMLAGLGNYGE
jgi:tetratricopeptide (TPR) repeat protein